MALFRHKYFCLIQNWDAPLFLLHFSINTDCYAENLFHVSKGEIVSEVINDSIITVR